MHFNQTCRMMVVIYIVFFKKFSLKKKTSERRNMDNNLMQRRKIAKIHFLNIFQHMSNKVQLKVFLLLNYSCMLSILLNKQLLLMKIKKQVYTIPNENDIKYFLTLNCKYIHKYDIQLMLNSLLSAQPGMINVFVLSMTKYILVYLKCALTFKHRFYMGLKIAHKWFLKFEKNSRCIFAGQNSSMCQDV